MRRDYWVIVMWVVCLAGTPPQRCSAVTNTWSGPNDGNWSEPVNWNQGTIPSSSDIVRFNQGTVRAVIDNNFTNSVGGLKVEQVSPSAQSLLLSLATDHEL